jgi:hypothetical protein
MPHSEIFAVCFQIHSKTNKYTCGQDVPRSKHTHSLLKTSHLMLYSKIITVCSQIHTEHINTLFRQYVPRSKHTASIIKTFQLILHSEYSLFVLRSTQNTERHCVDTTYRAVNTLILVYKNQSLSAVQWNNRS